MHLLDINVLIALVDPHHVHHRPARRWFLAHRVHGWSTCPLTENGMVRILSHPSYPGGGESTEGARSVLQALCAQPGHVFWPDSLTLRDSRCFKTLENGKQLTDSYLLALAVAHQGRLVTFDRKLSTRSVVDGKQALQVLSSR